MLRVDLDPIEALRGAQAGSPIAGELAHEYNLVTANPVGTLTINMGPGESGVRQQVTGLEWQHRKVPNGTKVIAVSPDNLYLEYGANDFDHFPPFRQEFVTALNGLAARFPNARANRVGLRYVNEIKLPQGNPLSWDGYIAASLREAVFAGYVQDSAMVRSMHQLQTRRGDVTLQCDQNRIVTFN